MIELVSVGSIEREERIDPTETGVNPAFYRVSSNVLDLKHLVATLYLELGLSKAWQYPTVQGK